MMKRRAHITKEGREQSVTDHLRNTATLASEYAAKAGCPNLGYLTGLLHDLGKGTEAFDSYIGLVSAGECWNKSKLNHSTAGARYITELLVDRTAVFEQFTLQLISEAIMCHHSGLCDNYTELGEDGYRKRLDTDTEIFYKEATGYFMDTVADETEIKDLFSKSVAEVETILKKIQGKNLHTSELYYASGLLMKLLFSCLIDADRYDTYSFMEGKAYTKQGDRQALWKQFASRVDDAIRNLNQETALNQARKYISDGCRQAADYESGVYTLNCPTGAGKTYSSIRFALHHAVKRKKRQIFYIIPFLSILDQNSQAIREVLGNDELAADSIAELHSDIIVDNQEEDYKLLTERMDAPIVLTTMVRFLNTFFGGGTQNGRPLHQLSDAIIIFDEIQTLPVRCIQMFNGAINFLTQICNSTCILCTATQPLLNRPHGNVRPIYMSEPESLVVLGEKVREVFGRVTPVDARVDGGYSVEALAAFAVEKATKEEECLVVMNTKTSALQLFQEIKACLSGQEKERDFQLYFLSTKLCPAHRKATIREIKSHLGTEPLIVVSTQLIEAGVDLSFRCAIRAIAGLDSWIQTAGRCNRHATWEQKNTYIVNPAFETLSYLKDIETGADCTHQVLNEYQKQPDSFDRDLFSDKAIQRYYELYLHKQRDKMFYSLKGKHKGQTLHELLAENGGYRTRTKEKQKEFRHYILGQAFETAGKEFEAIEQIGKTVLVPYEEGAELIASLLSSDAIWEKYELLRKAQQYAVNLTVQDMDALSGAIRFDENTGIYILSDLYYDDVMGVTLEASANNKLSYL